MKVTVILKDFADAFYDGHGDSIPSFLAMSEAEKFAKCKKLHGEKRSTMKIGSGAFRDAVELNSLTKSAHSIAFTLEPRRGYKLATFTFTKGTK
jgi:hypothetical protein